MVFLIALCIFLTLAVICLLVYQQLTAEARVVSERLDRFVERPPEAAVRTSELELPSDRSPTGIRGIIRRLSKFFESSNRDRTMENKLLRAGLPLRGAEFIVICIGTMLLGAGVFFVFSGKPFVALFGGLFGAYIPFLLIRVKTASRMKAFNRQLGDALVLISNSLRTGYSFMQAIDMVSREMKAPLSVEFGRTLKEMNLGVPTEEAMGNMAKRLDSEDLDLVLTAVIIQRQVGGNLSEILDNIAGTIRQRVRIRGEIKTLTAQGRLSGIIVSLLPVALGAGIFVINPGYVKVLIEHPIGRMMLGGAIVSQLLGIMMIRKIVNIRV